jgi:hypothetical protein
VVLQSLLFHAIVNPHAQASAMDVVTLIGGGLIGVGVDRFLKS